MKLNFKAHRSLIVRIQEDLRRPHQFAFERVGFVSCRFGVIDHGALVLAHDYHPVADEHYEVDQSVGARFGSAAIRSALEIAISKPVGIFHVHLHDHPGVPRPSSVDSREWAKFVPNFWHVRPELPHGALILSSDRIIGRCWYPGLIRPVAMSRFTVVDSHLTFWRVAR